MNGCKIYHNTVYTSPSPLNSGVSAFTLTEWYTGINGVEVYNNIFQSTGGAYMVNVPTGYDAVFNGNLYWPTGGTFKIRYHGTNYGSLSSWRAASGKELIGSQLTGISADPQLVNVGSNPIVWPAPTSSLSAYQLLPASPALNSGLNLTSLFAINTGSLDYFGSALASSNTRDIGAFEQPAVIVTALNEGVAAASEKIGYYPNPVNVGEAIHFTGGELPYSVELYSINGSLVRKDEQLTDEYLIPGTMNGVYIVKITDVKGKVYSGKIIVR
jgi:hypothetical protein